MTLAKREFARLLSEGIHRIRLREEKTVQIVQDELGYLLGREGGSAIEYWRKGHIPPELADVETLAREIVRRGQLEIAWLEAFLRSAAHPHPTCLHEELFPGRPTEGNPPAPATAGPIGAGTAFVVGPPISRPAHFFGRERTLRRLFNLWQRLPLQNGAIIGPRRSGKTSLLHYLRRITITPADQLRPGQRNNWLPQAHRYRWLFIDFQDARFGTQERLLRHLLSGLELPIPARCNLDYFLDAVSRGLDQPTIVLLDEIGVALARYPELDDAFWESLRSLATNQVGGQLAFVLAAQQSPAELAHQSSLGSPFFNIFGYSARLGPLTSEEAQQMIAASPRPIPPPEADWILAQSGRWPVLLQILCREYVMAREDGETGEGWRAEGLAQMAPFAYLPRGGE